MLWEKKGERVKGCKNYARSRSSGRLASSALKSEAVSWLPVNCTKKPASVVLGEEMLVLELGSLSGLFG